MLILKPCGWQLVNAQAAYTLLGGVERTSAYLATSRGYDVPQPVNYVG